MGEYAIRKSDGRQIKVGSCNSMYYCRYEQHKDVNYPFMCDNLLWRIPAIEEDGIEPGDFEYGALKDKDGYPLRSLWLDYMDDGEFDALGDDCNKGLVQLHVKELGMLVNVPCHHGIKLPESANDVKFFFNERRRPLYLQALKNAPDGLRIVIACAACGQMWSFEFEEIHKYILSLRMMLRLWKQVNEYKRGGSQKIKDWTYEANLVLPDVDYTYKARPYSVMKYRLNAEWVRVWDEEREECTGEIEYNYTINVERDGKPEGVITGVTNDWVAFCKVVSETMHLDGEWSHSMYKR